MPFLKVTKLSEDSLVLLNSVIISKKDSIENCDFGYAIISKNFIVCFRVSNNIERGLLEVPANIRTWLQLSLNQEIEVTLTQKIDLPMIENVAFEIDLVKKASQPSSPITSNEIEHEIKYRCNDFVISAQQTFILSIQDILISCSVRSIQPIGILKNETYCVFQSAASSKLQIVDTKNNPAMNILKQSFNFEKLGIGGLGKEFSTIFRRVFASRLLPAELASQFGLQHVKGLLLFGPPGTGKTLIARQIGKMLNTKEPIVVSGPEILNRYVGQSEENIRKLFAGAEADRSQLHLIIFDELDAICRQRGSTRSDSGVGDSVVNQLLAKMDGVEQLDNIVIIGMTNRKELIDDALLRPGRFEVQIEIGLPDFEGRKEILLIHTSDLRHSERIASDVDIDELALLCKNFTGAELCGLIKSATSFAISKHLKLEEAGLDPTINEACVCRDDFIRAFSEVHPANGIRNQDFKFIAQYGYINFDPVFVKILEECSLALKQVLNKKSRLVSVLLYGLPGTGKSSIASKLALEYGFQYARLISSHDMLGMSEYSKIAYIQKIFADASRSPDALIVLDSIEMIIEFVSIGPRFSSAILSALKDVISSSHEGHLVIIGTTEKIDILKSLNIADVFDRQIYIPPVTTRMQVKLVLEHLTRINETKFLDKSEISTYLEALPSRFELGIKTLLQIIGYCSELEENKTTVFAQSIEDSTNKNLF